MTTQKYKLVSVKPTFDMVQRAAHAYDRVVNKDTATTFLAMMERALAAAIAAAPEPVCRWTPAKRSLGRRKTGWFCPECTDGTAIRIECMNSGSLGYMVKPKACPLCGRKVEVVGDK